MNRPRILFRFVSAAFKVVHDARRGPIVFVRVYSGQLVARSVIANVSGQHTPLLSGGEVGSSGGGGGGGRVVQQNKERVMKLLHVYADSMTEVDTVDAGHICAIVGLKHTRTGDTLIGGADAKRSKRSKGGKKGSGGSRSKGQIVLAPIVSPEPVFCAAIEAESNEELVGLRESLDILVREDPSGEKRHLFVSCLVLSCLVLSCLVLSGLVLFRLTFSL
jgi:elongation factor G